MEKFVEAAELIGLLLAFGGFVVIILAKASISTAGGILIILTGMFRRQVGDKGGNRAKFKIFGQTFDMAGTLAGVAIFAGLAIALVGLLHQK